ATRGASLLSLPNVLVRSPVGSGTGHLLVAGPVLSIHRRGALRRHPLPGGGPLDAEATEVGGHETGGSRPTADHAGSGRHGTGRALTAERRSPRSPRLRARSRLSRGRGRRDRT